MLSRAAMLDGGCGATIEYQPVDTRALHPAGVLKHTSGLNIFAEGDRHPA